MAGLFAAASASPSMSPSFPEGSYSRFTIYAKIKNKSVMKRRY